MHIFLPKVHKLLIVVELLLGEIPDRLQFRQPSLKRSLMPYFLLTQGKDVWMLMPWLVSRPLCWSSETTPLVFIRIMFCSLLDFNMFD